MYFELPKEDLEDLEDVKHETDCIINFLYFLLVTYELLEQFIYFLMIF